MKTITSPENPLVKSLRELQTAKGRREQGLFVAEGPHLTEEALKAGVRLRYIIVRDEDISKYSGLLALSQEAGAEVLLLPPRLIVKISGTESPQGILVVAEIPTADLQTVGQSGSLAVVLERVQDPGNLGTILRTALAVNAGFAVLAAGCADPWSEKAVRASQGAVLHLPVVEAPDAAGAIAWLSQRGWHTACGHLSGSDFFKRAAHARTALVIGNEAAGISREAAEACGGLYKLPMPGAAESLNAAVAAGVMLYDLWREQSGTAGE